MNVTSSVRFLLSGVVVLVVGACMISTVTVTPAQARADTKQDGAALFASSGCGHCHGDSGQGTAKGPSLADLRKKMKADEATKQIKDGGKTMPPFGDSLDDKQIQELVKFLRSRHPKFQAPAPPKP